jgi:hypothetical protein
MLFRAWCRYIFIGFVFFRMYMNIEATDQSTTLLIKRMQGDNGAWTTVDTLVFILSSFTTIGYGNHPTLKSSLPPCEFPSAQLSEDNPFSVLLPPSLKTSRISRNWYQHAEVSQSWTELSLDCFDDEIAPQNTTGRAGCRVIADDRHVFDFDRQLLFTLGTLSTPRNMSNRAQDLMQMEVPGGLGQWDCGVHKENASVCFARYSEDCERQLLEVRVQ